MRILADENFPGLSVQELRSLGHDVVGTHSHARRSR